MELTPEETETLAEIIIRAVRDCQTILARAAQRGQQTAARSQSLRLDVPPSQGPALLTRFAAAQFLRSELGYPVSKSTLDKLAVTGGGPPFQTFGRRVVYQRDDLKAWAEGRARRRTSTSDPGQALGWKGSSDGV